MNVAPTINSRKPFAWSYSALKEYEICPRRYYECRVTKAWGQDKTPELDRGDALHLAMKHRVMKGTPLPMEFSYMETWAKGLTATSDPIYCEMKLSVDKDMKLTPYFDKRTWLRGVIDYAQISPLPTDGRISMKVATVVDYKTGRPKEDDTQLALNACLMFAHADDVVGINTSFLWTEYNDTSRTAFMRRDAKGIWNDIKPRVAVLEQAVAAGEFPPTKNKLCREWCPVLSCEYNGKR